MARNLNGIFIQLADVEKKIFGGDVQVACDFPVHTLNVCTLLVNRLKMNCSVRYTGWAS